MNNRLRVETALYGPSDRPVDVALWRARFSVPVLFAVGAAIGLLRIPFTSWGILWAEDSTIFLHGAISNNPGLAIVTPYAGYLHLVPRLLAIVLAAVVPLPAIGVAISVVSVSVTAALGVFVYQLTRGRFTSRWVSLLVWFSWITMSMTAGDVLGSLANLHWFFTAAAIWALLMRHRTAAMRVIALIVIVLAILSDGLMLGLIPLVLIRVLLSEKPGRRRFAIVTGVAYLIQIAAVIVAPFIETRVSIYRQAPSALYLLHQYAIRVVLAGGAGVHVTQALVNRFDWIWILVAIVFLALIVVVALRGHNRLVAAVMVLYSLGLFFGCWITVGGGYSLVELYFEGRYAVIPIMLLIAAIAFVLDGWLFSLNRPRVRITLLGAATVLMLVVFVIDFHVWNARGAGEDVATAINSASRACASEPPDHVVSIPVAPLPMWDLKLSCEQVLHGVH